jgi:hypothetical protein
MGARTQPLAIIPLTPRLEPGQLRFVLSWPDAPADLDLHSIFKVSRLTKCEVFFGKKVCGGVGLDIDNIEGGKNGVETITLRDLGKYVYTIAVHRFIDDSNGKSDGEEPIADSPVEPNSTNSNIPRIPLKDSKATLSVYVKGFKGPIHELTVPNQLIAPTADAGDYNWWTAFCLDGNVGMRTLTAINELSIEKPNHTKCEEFYKTPKPTPTSLIQKALTRSLLQKSMKNKKTKVL